MPTNAKRKSTCIFPPPPLQSEVSIERMAAELKSVRATIKDVRKRVQTSQKPWTPSMALKRQAALVYEMCQDTRWGIIFVKMHQQRHMFRTTRLPREITPTTVTDWWRTLRHSPKFKAACAELANPDRMKIDQFLIETALYEFVLEKSAMQLVVPSSAMVAKYITAWESRPMSEITRSRLTDMQNKKVLRHNWCYRFRQRWDVAWGVSPPGKAMSIEEMKFRAQSLIRSMIGRYRDRL